MIDYYEILGLGVTASDADIKESYRRLVHLSHPDKGGTAALFRLVHEAFEVLSNPTTRRAYDEELSGSTVSAVPHGGEGSGKGSERDAHRDGATREHEPEAGARKDAGRRDQNERERTRREREARERAERELILQLLANDLEQLLCQRRQELQLRRVTLFPKVNSRIRPSSDLSSRSDRLPPQVDLLGCYGTALLLLAGVLTVGVLMAVLLR